MGQKKLGFGLMRLPLIDKTDNGSVDIEHTKKMVDAFIEKGFTYFDTAWMYCKHQSEHATKEALVDRYPRESYTLATKLHANFFETMAERDAIFEEQMRKTGVTYFDYYLLHDMNQERYEKYERLDCFNWIMDKKAKGLVKTIGFSFHDNAELLDKILTEHPEMEFVQLQINYIDWESDDVQSRKCYEVAVRHGVPVIVMEPVKGGMLANVPKEVEKLFKDYNAEMSIPSWAIRFAASLNNVFMVLSGMSNTEQLLDNTNYMEDFTPLSEEELALVDKAVEIIKSQVEIPCTGCAYCVEGCPVNIPIPAYFNLVNECAKKMDPFGKYEKLSENKGKASECVECGQCEAICPQHIHIIDELKKVAERFEK